MDMQSPHDEIFRHKKLKNAAIILRFTCKGVFSESHLFHSLNVLNLLSPRYDLGRQVLECTFLAELFSTQLTS